MTCNYCGSNQEKMMKEPIRKNYPTQEAYEKAMADYKLEQAFQRKAGHLRGKKGKRNDEWRILEAERREAFSDDPDADDYS